MKARLISHASILIKAGDVQVLCDPWQMGTAFNGSWKLIAPADPLGAQLDAITHVWISHEHPDHFHIPTLASLPADFKERVTVLFQHNHSDKMVQALKGKLGFKTVVTLPHRKFVSIAPGVEVYCFHSRQLDSALAVRHGREVVLNLNDCECSETDLAQISSDLGRIDHLFNQFSIAGSEGAEAAVRANAAEVKANYIRDAKMLGVSAVTPFASFVRFCMEDNAWMNGFANRPRDIVAAMEGQAARSVVMAPGNEIEIGQSWDNGAALRFWDDAYAAAAHVAPDASPIVPAAKIETAFHALAAKVKAKYSALLLAALQPVVFRVPDLDQTWKMDFKTGRFEAAAAGEAAHLEILSQPLHFALAYPFGVQTLGVSGRYKLLDGAGNWVKHRFLFALNNAEIYLSLRHVFDRKLISYFWSRREGLLSQVRYRIKRARGVAGAAPQPSLVADP
jgi:UDP-MurNAc hydroxylase